MLSSKQNILSLFSLNPSYAALENTSKARQTYWPFFVNRTTLRQNLRISENVPQLTQNISIRYH